MNQLYLPITNKPTKPIPMKILANTKQLPITDVTVDLSTSKASVSIQLGIPRRLTPGERNHGIITGFTLWGKMDKEGIKAHLFNHFGIPSNIINWI